MSDRNDEIVLKRGWANQTSGARVIPVGEPAKREKPKGYTRCPGCGGLVKMPCILCGSENANS